MQCAPLGLAAHRRVVALARHRRFASDRRGTTMIEFALLGAPFIILVMGIFELALMLLVAGNLDTAVAIAARQGGMAATSPTAAALRTNICGEMPNFGRDCAAALTVTIETLATPAGQSDIVIVRAVYNWPVLNPIVSGVLAAGADDPGFNFVSTNAFRSEAG